MSSTEEIIWVEKAGLKDFYANPVLWIKTLFTLGLYLIYTYVNGGELDTSVAE
jgi:hypothetical protein